MAIYTSGGTLLTGTVVTIGTAVPSSQVRKLLKGTAYNPTGSAVVLAIYLGTTGASPNQIINKSIAAGTTYNCPELVGNAIPAASYVWASGNGIEFSFVSLDDPNTT